MNAPILLPLNGTYRPSYMAVTTQPDVVKVQEDLLIQAETTTLIEYAKYPIVHCYRRKLQVIYLKRFLELHLSGKLSKADQFIPVWLNLDRKFDGDQMSQLIHADLRRMVMRVLESRKIVNTYNKRIRDAFKA